MKSKTNFSIKDTFSILSNITPLVFSMAVCAGMGAFAGAVFACIACLVSAVTEPKKQMPLYLSLLIITYTFKEFGASTLALSMVICGIFLLIASFFFKKSELNAENFINSPVVGGIMLSCALTVTIIFTTDYFGIGATGNTAKEMISSYLSLGFHPNWRGVLYGTIVMVIMITFPRKFKKATKVISAAFIALIVTTILNLFLNPSDMITAIREAGAFSFEDYKNTLILPIFNSKPHILYSIFCGLSLFFTYSYLLLQNRFCNNSENISYGITNRITASVLTAIIFFALQGFIARIPVHSCAVVLIVGAWQSVKWSEVKKTFLSVWGILIFIIILISGLYRGFTWVPAYAFVLYRSYFALTSRDKYSV